MAQSGQANGPRLLEDPELNASGIACRLTEICDQALRKLMKFAPFEIATKAVTESIVTLERLTDRDPEQVQQLQKLKQAFQDLQEGVGSTRRMLLERCKLRERASI